MPTKGALQRSEHVLAAMYTDVCECPLVDTSTSQGIFILQRIARPNVAECAHDLILSALAGLGVSSKPQFEA